MVVQRAFRILGASRLYSIGLSISASAVLLGSGVLVTRSVALAVLIAGAVGILVFGLLIGRRLLLGDAVQLRAQALALSTEIDQFVADRARGDPMRRLTRSSPSGLTEEERSRRWQQDNDDAMSHFQETMTAYRERFGGRAWALYSALRRAGLIGHESQRRFEWAVNSFGIDEVARALAAVGHES